jgi:hypothetical protein
MLIVIDNGRSSMRGAWRDEIHPPLFHVVFEFGRENCFFFRTGVNALVGRWRWLPRVWVQRPL